MTFAKCFAGALVAFLALDLVWISQVVRPMYDQQIPGLLRAQPQLGPAAIFYLLYAGGIVYFAVLPALAIDSIKAATLKGAILGGLCYGTYAFTNHAVITASAVFEMD